MTDLPQARDSWLSSVSHQQWLHDQGQSLVDFAKAARVPNGFASLDRLGQRANDAQADTVTPRVWFTASPSPIFRACRAAPH